MDIRVIRIAVIVTGIVLALKYDSNHRASTLPRPDATTAAPSTPTTAGS